MPLEHPEYSSLAHAPFIRAIFNDSAKNGTICVAQNAKFDNRWLRSRGITPHTEFDTYIASYLLNNTLPHGLKHMAKVEFGAPQYDTGVEFTEAFPLEQLAEYCAKDCYYTLKLYYRLSERMKLYVPTKSPGSI